MTALVFRIVTCSDSRTMETDIAGAALEELISAQGWSCAGRVVVSDERSEIAAAIIKAAEATDEKGRKTDIVLTCGGTGLSLRDVTPEATRDACEREVAGIAEAMREYSRTKTPLAALSRAVVMQRGRVLVVNLPGSEKAARENWEPLIPLLPHAISMMAGQGH